MNTPFDDLTRRNLLKLGGVAAAAMAAPSLVLGAGNSDKELLVYTWETYHLDEWLKQWTAKTGIAVKTVLTGSADEMYATLTSGAIQPDIILADVGALKRYIANKMVVPLDLSKIPNAQYVSNNLGWQRRNTQNGQVYGVPYNWGGSPLMFNSSVRDAGLDLSTWDALWSPKVQGKVSLYDDGYATLPMVAAKVGAKDVFNLTEDEFAKVADALRALRPQVVSIARGPSDQAAAFASGDATAGYCMIVNSVYELNQHAGKQQFGYTFPRPGAIGWIDNLAITPKGNKPASYQFINDVLTPQWQARFINSANTNGVLSSEQARNAGVTDATLKQTTILDQDAPGFEQNLITLDLPEDIDRRIQLWNDFKAGTL